MKSCLLDVSDQGAEEAVPGPSVFPSREPGVSGDFWGSQEGCQGPDLLASPQMARLIPLLSLLPLPGNPLLGDLHGSLIPHLQILAQMQPFQ